MSRLLLLGFAFSTVAGDAGVLPPLSAAARRGDLATMRALLAKGADPDEPAPDGAHWPPLLHAVHTRQLAAAALLLDSGADPDGAGRHGCTALMMAAADGDPRIVALLLDRGADPHRLGPGGISALSQAVTGGALADIDRPVPDGRHEETVRLLLDRAPDLTRPGNAPGAEARFWARLHAGLQKMRNVALAPTTGAPQIDCGEIFALVERRAAVNSDR